MDIRPQNPHGFHLAAQCTDDHSRVVCKNSDLQKITRAFVRNMSRVRGIGMLPINLITTTVINEAARMEALSNLGIPFHDPRITYPNPSFDDALFEKVDTERKRLVDEWLQKQGANDGRRFDAGAYHLNIIIDANVKESWEGIQATLAAMLMGLWTAFESLVQDTWVTAVNARPDPLGTRIVKRSADLNLGSQIKSISWDSILKVRFDLTDSLGTVLLDQRAVDFQRLNSIRRAYEITFANEFEAIFSKHYDALQELEAVRNLFAHKGGVIDDRFKSKVKSPPNMEVDNIYCVTGQYVAEQADTVSKCSTALVVGVDDWLEKNQPTS